MKRVLIVTGASDELRFESWPPNDSIEKVFNLTLPSKEKYAERHGYDLLITRSFGEDRNKIFNKNHFGFMRVVRTFELAFYAYVSGTYDFIFWIDGDALITNPRFSIEDFVTEDKREIYYVSWDWGANDKDNDRFSNSSWIIKVGDDANEFYQKFLTFAKRNLESFANEQDMLNAIYQLEEPRGYFKILDHKYLNSVPDHEKVIANRNKQEIFRPWKKGDFLCHFTGISNEKRLYLINKYFKKFL